LFICDLFIVINKYKALMTALNAPNPPLCLLVGKAAEDFIDKYLKERRSEFETWCEVSANTDFD
jgi:hypothetical protein